MSGRDGGIVSMPDLSTSVRVNFPSCLLYIDAQYYIDPPEPIVLYVAKSCIKYVRSFRIPAIPRVPVSMPSFYVPVHYY